MIDNILTLIKTDDNLIAAIDSNGRNYFLMSKQYVGGSDKYIEFPITLKDITDMLIEIEGKNKNEALDR